LHQATKFHPNRTIPGGIMMSCRVFQDGDRQPCWIWSG